MEKIETYEGFLKKAKETFEKINPLYCQCVEMDNDIWDRSEVTIAMDYMTRVFEDISRYPNLSKKEFNKNPKGYLEYFNDDFKPFIDKIKRTERTIKKMHESFAAADTKFMMNMLANIEKTNADCYNHWIPLTEKEIKAKNWKKAAELLAAGPFFERFRRHELFAHYDELNVERLAKKIPHQKKIYADYFKIKKIGDEICKAIPRKHAWNAHFEFMDKEIDSYKENSIVALAAIIEKLKKCPEGSKEWIDFLESDLKKISSIRHKASSYMLQIKLYKENLGIEKT